MTFISCKSRVIIRRNNLLFLCSAVQLPGILSNREIAIVRVLSPLAYLEVCTWDHCTMTQSISRSCKQNTHVLFFYTPRLCLHCSIRMNIIYIYISMTHQVILLTYKVFTSTFNRDIPHQHPSNIICHIILHNNKNLKWFISLICYPFKILFSPLCFTWWDE
jgi:hypothetical protein